MTDDRPSSVSQPRGKALRLHRGLARIWGSDQRFRGWFTTSNNNDIGTLFLIVATSFFVIGGILAMLIRTQLADTGLGLHGAAGLQPDLYDAWHCDDVPVRDPRSSRRCRCYCCRACWAPAIWRSRALGPTDFGFYIFGGSAVIIAMLMGLAPDGGWFMYPPLSSAAFSPGIGADVWLLGITSIEVSAIATAIEVIVTVLRYRAAGMSLSRMPIFAWYILVVSVMILTAFPPMILGSLLLEGGTRAELAVL